MEQDSQGRSNGFTSDRALSDLAMGKLKPLFLGFLAIFILLLTFIFSWWPQEAAEGLAFLMCSVLWGVFAIIAVYLLDRSWFKKATVGETGLILSSDHELPGTDVSRGECTFAKIAQLRVHKGRLILVKTDGDILHIPWKESSVRDRQELAEILQKYFREELGQEVPVRLDTGKGAAETHPGREQTSFSRKELEFLGKIIGVIQPLILILLILLLGYLAIFWVALTEGGALSAGDTGRFSFFLLFFLGVLVVSRFILEALETGARELGLGLYSGLFQRYHIIVARQDGFNELQKGLEWDKFGKGAKGSVRGNWLGFQQGICTLYLTIATMFIFFGTLDLLNRLISKGESLAEIAAWLSPASRGLGLLLLTLAFYVYKRYVSRERDRIVQGLTREFLAEINRRYWEG